MRGEAQATHQRLPRRVLRVTVLVLPLLAAVLRAQSPRLRTRFRVAFGSCARFRTDGVQPIWTAVEQAAPDLFFWLGDNIYGDALDDDILAEEYRRQRDVLALQPVLHSVPQLAVWDDHDFGINNGDRRHPTKEDALAAFRRYWANPSYGLAAAPGVFFRYQYGGVDFFFLDDRHHRDPNKAPDVPAKPMLGAAQLEWLKRGLRESAAPFKILIIRPVHDRGVNFGLLEFDLTGEPELRFSLVNDRGDVVWPPLVLRASELTNGVASWRSKVLPPRK